MNGRIYVMETKVKARKWKRPDATDEMETKRRAFSARRSNVVTTILCRRSKLCNKMHLKFHLTISIERKAREESWIETKV